jgi:hypothetical protein
MTAYKHIGDPSEDSPEKILAAFVKSYSRIRRMIVQKRGQPVLLLHDLRYLRDRARIQLGMIKAHAVADEAYEEELHHGQYPHD